MPVTTEIDTNNDFDWATRTIREDVIFSRVYRDVTTTFDDGHIAVENAIDGVVTRVRVTDPTDVLPFQEMLTVYNTDGTIRSIDRLDDTGQRSVETYENGVLVTVVKTDETGTRAWSEVTINFDDGVVDSYNIDYRALPDFGAPRRDSGEANFLSEIVYSTDDAGDWNITTNGRSGTSNWIYTIESHGGQTEEMFRNGVRDGINQYDYGDVADWLTIRTLHDNDGVITTRFTQNDNGSSFIESFDAGVLTATRLQDNGTDPVYRSIDSTFDADGNLTSRVTENDRGPVITESFDAGVLTSLKEASLSGLTVETFFDADGNAIRRDTTAADGSFVSEILRETRVQTDDAGTANWSQITTVVDGAGQVLEREVDFDNGNNRLETFEGGRLVARLATEADGDTRLDTFDTGTRVAIEKADVSNSQGWATQTINFDANGQVSGKNILLDDGGTKVETYADGVLQSSVQRDLGDSKTWSDITATFDATGALVARFTTYDNGTTRDEGFANGQRTTITSLDADNAKNWQSIVLQFGTDGQRQTETTVADTGVTTQSAYQDGQITTSVREDVADAFEFSTVTSTYDAGQLSRRATTYDNADEMVFLFENQERVARLDVDGDNSEDWAVALTEYGAAGAVTTTFAAIDDLPSQYGYLFAADIG